MSVIENRMGLVGEVAQWIKSLLYEHENRRSDREGLTLKLGVVACAHNPSNGRWDGGGVKWQRQVGSWSLLAIWFSQMLSTRFSETLAQNKQTNK